MPAVSRLIRLAAILALPLLAGCSTLGYYSQAVRGHLDIIARTRPIDEVLRDPALPPDQRARLQLAQRARAFAVRELGLPDNGSYRRYADLGRSRVVWNVTATAEFSTRPEQSCFLVVGCLNYRGFFDRADAEAHAATLAAAGRDVHVSGATAYSTLGWFEDPLLNTMLMRPEADLVEVIFHELAHQRLYIDHDSGFNEAFATAVAQYGLRRWYEAHGEAAAYTAVRAGRERRRDFYQLLVQTRRRLTELYASDLPAAAMRTRKRAEFERMRADYALLKAHWGGYRGYDDYMARDLNNAHLSLVATYHERVPAFLALIERHGGDLDAFYSAAADIGRLPRHERHARLAALVTEPDVPPLLSAER